VRISTPVLARTAERIVPHAITKAIRSSVRISTPVLARTAKRIVPRAMMKLIRLCNSRVRFAAGVRPLNGDRGEPINREYVNLFLHEVSSVIRGRCLEFQENTYTSRFGADRVRAIDILHKELGNPNATIVADLTKKNGIPSDSFDCIICTYVLHGVFDFEKMVAELHRILKPNGVLLVAVPHIDRLNPELQGLPGFDFEPFWRFTEKGLRILLANHFGAGNVMVRGYGNSLTAAGHLRGLVGRDFTRAEVEYQDPRYAIVLCASGTKRASEVTLSKSLAMFLVTYNIGVAISMSVGGGSLLF
jgi:SAM-dependent methyltransferase